MKPFTKIAGVLFGIVALLHLVRLVLNWNVVIDNFEVPAWISIFGFIIASTISYGLFRETKQVS